MAITFVGAAAGGTAGSVTSYTFAYTCGSGSNRLLVVGLAIQPEGADLVTGVTYSGVAMTLARKQICPPADPTADSDCYLYYLLNPASGTHDVVVTLSSSGRVNGSVAADYAGVRQSAQPDAVNGVTSAAPTIMTEPITTVADNSWAIFANAYYSYGSPVTAVANCTRRVDDSTSVALFDSGGDITPAGLFTMGTTQTSNDYKSTAAIASFSPATSPPPPPPPPPPPTTTIVTLHRGMPRSLTRSFRS